MAACFELMISIENPPSSVSFQGRTIWPVDSAFDQVSCMSASSVNPWLRPISGHFWVPDPAISFFEGVTLDDSIAVSWGVILVWITAFCIRSMRRPIR